LSRNNASNRKRTLLIGAGGFLGSYFEAFFQKNEEIQLQSTKDYIQSEVQVSKLIQEFKPELILNCSAKTDIDECEKNPEEAYFVNAEIPKFLGEHSRRIESQLVHFSTDAVYDSSVKIRREDSKIAPISVYGKSKLAGEQLLQDLDPSALILRTNFFGDNPKNRSLFNYFYSKLTAGERVFGFTDVLFNPIYVESLVEMTYTLALKESIGIYNIAGEETLSKHEFCRKLIKTFGLNEELLLTSELTPTNAGTIRSHNLTLDIGRLLALVGKPVSVSDGLELMKNHLFLKRG
jgi:dTDP-4-dehydrorhamnose reductase